MRRTGLIVVLMSIVVMFVVAQVAVQAAPVRTEDENVLQRLNLDLAAVLVQGESRTLVDIRHYGVIPVPMPESNWVPFNVAVGPDGRWAVDGHHQIEGTDIYEGGLRVQYGNNWQWEVVSHICTHQIGGWLSTEEIGTTGCWSVSALGVAMTGEERAISPTLPPEWQVEVAGCPATGRVAIIEEHLEDFPEGEPPRYRLIVANPDGTREEFPWGGGRLENLDWSPDGNWLMYTQPVEVDGQPKKRLVLTRMVDDDVDIARFLPDGGYVVGDVVDDVTNLTLVPNGTEGGTLAVVGRLESLDPFVSGSTPRRPPFGRRALR